jgi:hypothetical protein
MRGAPPLPGSYTTLYGVWCMVCEVPYRETGRPVDTGCLPLSHSGNPGANVSDREGAAVFWVLRARERRHVEDEAKKHK